MRIEHIAMNVKDLEGMKNFYATYFGAKSGAKYHNVNTGLQTYFLSFDDGSRLELMTSPKLVYKRPTPKDEGLIHLAFSVGSRQGVDALTQRLRTDGVKIVSEPRTTGDGYYESCILDPQGNFIEITA